jgi:drug/metabolite transporter (DMT)-like permease
VTRRSILAVVLWMMGALLSFSATAVAVRALAPRFSVFEMLSFRSIAAVLFLLALAAFKPQLRAQMRTRRLGLHVLRNAIHFTGTFSWTLGVTLLPLATVFALEFTTPAWVALLAVLLLGEVMTRSRAAAVVLGFVGVLIILRPGLESLRPASLIVLGSALAFALTAICTKKLTATDPTFTILFWMNLVQMPLTLAGAGSWFWLKVSPRTSRRSRPCASGVCSRISA